MTLLTWVKTQYLHTPTPSWRVRLWAVQWLWGAMLWSTTCTASGAPLSLWVELHPSQWTEVPVICCTMRPFLWVSLDVLIIFVCHKLVCLAILLCVIPSFILILCSLLQAVCLHSQVSTKTIELLCMTCSRHVTLVSYMADPCSVSCMWGEPEVPAEEWPCGSRVPQGCHVVEWPSPCLRSREGDVWLICFKNFVNISCHLYCYYVVIGDN